MQRIMSTRDDKDETTTSPGRRRRMCTWFTEHALGWDQEVREYMPHHLQLATLRDPAHLVTRACWRTGTLARLDDLWCA